MFFIYSAKDNTNRQWLCSKKFIMQWQKKKKKEAKYREKKQTWAKLRKNKKNETVQNSTGLQDTFF